MDGTLHIVDGRPMLRFERRLAHPVGKVWRAITDPAELPHWFPWQVELEPRIGGTMRFTHPTGAATAPDAVITEWDPPRVFAYRWNDGELRWELRADGDGCVLVFTHSFAELPPAAKFAAGWHLSLDALDAVLSGRPVSAQGWADLNDGYVRAFGLLDGEVTGDDLRFAQEVVYPVDVVWRALAGDARLGEPPPASCVVAEAPAGPVSELRCPTSLVYPALGGVVRFELEPQDFGTRIVLTQTRCGERLAAVRSAWRERLVALPSELGS